jgi:hypothetical protein
MKTTNYRRGATKEYEWMKTLRGLYDERGFVYGIDYIVQRSSGSHTPFDIVLWNLKEGEIHAYQLKYVNTYKKVFYEKSKKEFKDFKKLKPIISLWKHYIVFVKGSKEPIFLWSEK